MQKSLRLLAIEDSEEDVILLTRELRAGGYEADWERVETAEAMKSAIAQEQWDIIISDYIMPQFSGLDALDLVKQSGIDIPFIIVSGKIGEDIAVEAMKAGAHDYIVKGNLARLVPAVERELREAETRKARRLAEEELKRYREHLEELVASRTDELKGANEQLQLEISDRKMAEEALRKAVKRARDEKAKSEAIIAALGDGIVIQDREYRITYQNRIHKKLIGDQLGQYCYLAYRSSGDVCEDCPIEMSFDDGRIHKAERTIKTDKGVLNIEVTASPLRDATGEIISGIEVVRDVTERRKMENELREHRDHLDLLVKERTAELRRVNRELRAEIMRRIQMEKDLIESQRFVHRIADATPNILYLYDVIENKNIYVNSIVKEVLGYTSEAIKKMKSAFFKALLHPDDTPVISAMAERFRNAKDGDIIESEYRLKNAKGEWRWFYSRDIVFKRTSDGLLKLILGISQDVTERKVVEQELKNSREQLRILLAHVQSVREDERTRISREIHDELGQSLTALKIDLSWLLKRLSKEQKPLVEKAELMSNLIDMNIQTVKRISAELRPGLLDDLGLPAAFEWQAEDFQKRTGIHCEVRIQPEDIALDRNLSTAIFRIFQETLTNVVRHAKAKNVGVTLTKKKEEVLLEVKDDGKGITEKQISSPKSIGLIGMRERVHFFGGGVKISGKKDKGTVVTVTIPIKNATESGGAASADKSAKSRTVIGARA
ncbi:MAG: PAS domain S-box protein [Acidobacteriota bacterium]